MLDTTSRAIAFSSALCWFISTVLLTGTVTGGDVPPLEPNAVQLISNAGEQQAVEPPAGELWAIQAASQDSTAECNSCVLCDCSPPDFWVINTRCAPRCTNLDEGFECLSYEHWDPSCQQFKKESREAFLACQSNIPTLLFSHGNSLKHKGALESGWRMYQRLKSCPGPKVLVLWSWPAQIVYKRPILTPLKTTKKNIQTKYVYAEHQGYYIAKLVSSMDTTRPLTLSGHSFGAVAMASALHYLGHGCLNGLMFEEGYASTHANLRGSLISPAMDNDHLYPGHRYSQAMVAVERLHTTYSTMDATLKRWPNYSFRGKEALAYTGMCASLLCENESKLLQQNLTCDVGKSHYMKEHLASPQMIQAICSVAFDGPACDCGYNPKEKVDVQDILQAPARAVIPFSGQ